ncbi:MAG: RelA/SpoT family protein [Acidobacteriota bacterium]
MGEPLPRFEDILELVASYNPACDEDLLRRAYVYSAMAHRGQVRLSGEPYLVHPLEVARVLAEMHLDEVAIVTGLLHDLLEDTMVTEADLAAQFGERITGLVRALTKISAMEHSFAARQAAQAETFRRMLLASIEDVRVVLVKLADRLHNMRTLHFIPDEGRRRRIASETLEIYAPIAHRLGMGRIKAELEDLALAQIHPEEHGMLVEQLQQRETEAVELIGEIRSAIAGVLQEHSLPGEVGGRIKHLYSIWTKLRKQGISVDRVYDFLAFRIVVDSVPHCYAALGLIHQLWRPVPGRIKDYIAMPKPNAYQSLHTSVIGPRGQPFEVQIRTGDMDEIAERGIAAHWLYKEGGSAPSQDAERVSWLRSLVEGHQENPRDFLDSLKLNLYPEEVYTFTPKGEVYAFPRGATPIDFAFRVHTEVGSRCVGARVNGRLVPLRTVLQNGDIVEILTSPNQVPSRDWLELAVTARAKNKIRAWLNRGEKDQAIDAGRRLLDRECRKSGVTIKQLRDDGRLDRLASDHGYPKEDDLLAALGYGRLAPRDLLAPIARSAPQQQAAARQRASGHDEAVIVVKGQRDMLTFRAQCCNPLPGDDIVGYVTRGRGVAVHSANCPNVRKLLFASEREVEVEWGGEAGSYPAPLHVGFEDRPGMLAALSQAVSGEEANIRSCHLATHEGRMGTADLVVDVRGRGHLERVVAALRRVGGVTTVEGSNAAQARRLHLM